MYSVKLQYFDTAGRMLGTGSMLSPGKDPRALIEFVKRQNTRTFCGLGPAYIYVSPESGEPVLVKLEG